jgi:hypothetical protein
LIAAIRYREPRDAAPGKKLISTERVPQKKGDSHALVFQFMHLEFRDCRVLVVEQPQPIHD